MKLKLKPLPLTTNTEQLNYQYGRQLKVDPTFSFENLKALKRSSIEKGRKIAPSYWVKHNEPDNTMDVYWRPAYRKSEIKPFVVGRRFPSGNFWFYPQRTLTSRYLAVIEARLLFKFVGVQMVRTENQHAKGIWYFQGKWHRRIAIPTNERKISDGWVLFDSEGSVLNMAPPQKRYVDIERANELRAAIKKLKTDTTIRVKLGALEFKSEIPYPSRYEVQHNDALIRMITKASQDDINSYQELVNYAVWRNGRYYATTHNFNLLECIDRFLKWAQRTLLRQLDIVKYA